ncbi:hypothetical protein [Embleya sp. NPDC005575]|uniref:hypothetical protein n=1 Tax=Embleya sp. NPDC005575 TaxID=3156892 RepID=UPI0033ACB790
MAAAIAWKLVGRHGFPTDLSEEGSIVSARTITRPPATTSGTRSCRSCLPPPNRGKVSVKGQLVKCPNCKGTGQI